MSGLSNVLDVSVTGLDAYHTALNTVSENISNANTPGYAQRSTQLATNFEGPGQSAGTGVLVQGVSRATSRLANTQLRAANADQGYATALSSALNALQVNFPSQGGISAALGQFLTDAQNLAVRPADAASRQVLLADGQQLAGSFQQTAGNMQSSIQGLTQSGTDLAKQVNQILGQLATVNTQLRSSPSNSVNGLLDNQSQLLQSLSGLLGFNAVRYANGTVRLAVDGQVLLDPAGAHSVTFSMSPGATPQLLVAGGHALRAASVSGQLGGTFGAIVQSQAQLQNVDWMAAQTADAVNTQQALGLNATGSQGQPLFTTTAPSVVAAAANTGGETLQAVLQNPAALPDGGGPYTLDYNGSHWQATNLATGETDDLGNSSVLSFDGLQVTVSGGAPQAGDAFTLNPVAGSANAMRFTATSADAIAAAAPYVATAGSVSASGAVTDTNAGNASLGAGTVTANPGSATVVPGSTFGEPLQVTFTSPTAYTITSTSGTVVASGSYSAASGGNIAMAYPAGSAAAGSYWTIPISGAPASGDTFTLETGGSQSGANADALGQLGNASQLPDGGLTSAWAKVTGDMGTAAASANNALSNANTNASAASAAQQAVSGVSLDEQAADMQLYSQAYQAAAKAISTVDQLFQSLMQAV